MRYKLLPEVCDIQYGYAFDSKLFSDNVGTPIVRIRDVVRGYSETKTSELCPDNYNVENGDILIGMDGEFNIAKWNGGHAVLNQRVCKLIPKNQEIESDYLFFYMPKALKAIEDKTPFVTVKHLSAKELNKIIVPIPNRERQITISNQLKLLNTLLGKYNRIDTRLDELIKSRFVEMFGDFSFNTKGWAVEKFTNIAIIDGNMTTDFEKYANYPHIGIDSIERDTGRLSGYRTVAEDRVVSGKYLFTNKHIIYSKIRPNLNKVALPDFNGVCSADAYPILPNEDKCNRIFLAYVLRSDYFLDYILQFCTRTNLPKVNKKEVSGFRTPLPPLELQNQFADFVTQVEQQKAIVQQSIDKLETLKKSLTQDYFG